MRRARRSFARPGSRACAAAIARHGVGMSGHRPLPRLVAACALSLVSLPSIAAAQYAPYPQGNAPPGQYGPYSPSPYGQQIPYSQPGYTPLRSNSGDDLLADHAHSWPIMRASLGAGANLDQSGLVRPSFDFDATLGSRFALARRFFVIGEIGYSLNSEPRYGGHFGTAGAGAAVYLARMVSIGWIPKLVIGATNLDFGIGVRNTLFVPLFMHVVNIELGHQFMVTQGHEVHEARGQIGIDLAAAVHLYAWLFVGKGR